MRTERRAFRGLDGLCAVFALGAVGAIATFVLRERAAARPAQAVPSLSRAHDVVASAKRAARDGRFADAEAGYREALRIRPGSRTIGVHLARFYDERHDGPKALAVYRSLVEPELRQGRPTFGGAPVLRRYGDLCDQAGEGEEARRVYRTLIERARRSWIAWNENDPTGLLRTKATWTSEGSAALPKAIALDARNWEARRERVRDLALRERRPEALAALDDFRKCVGRNPRDVRGRVAYGTTLFEQGRRKGGLAFLRASLPLARPEERESIAATIRIFEREARSASPIAASGAASSASGRPGGLRDFGGATGPSRWTPPAPLLKDDDDRALTGILFLPGTVRRVAVNLPRGGSQQG